MSNVVLNCIRNEIRESYEVKQELLENASTVATIYRVAQKCVEAYSRGNKALIAGNGGSASDALHMAAELSGRFKIDRPGIPAMALTANISTITAIGNDYGYDRVFSRQIQANGTRGDVFLGLSTSGKSANIVRAVEACKEKGIISVGLTGKSGNKLTELCDYCITVPSTNTARIQESHILIVHIICGVVEEAMFGETSNLAPAVAVV